MNVTIPAVLAIGAGILLIAGLWTPIVGASVALIEIWKIIMGTLRCDGCGPQSVDKRVAEKQARWLEKVLAEEHERDRKHSDRIELPD